MTGSDHTSAERSGEQAVTELERLREVLLGDDRAEAQEALRSYWRTSKPVLTALAAAVGEQLRVQALQALKEWRAELDRR